MSAAPLVAVFTAENMRAASDKTARFVTVLQDRGYSVAFPGIRKFGPGTFELRGAAAGFSVAYWPTGAGDLVTQ